mmetsp:Transcript_26096/g.31587  ORF Transcript_26096/g.31587 Transcript_26096/m.31587 type:complete len:80 (+) Transcript_26096:167-406(+)|eukprot:CAMPEP_0172515572 /NCGR_PEP_ID=MMETSP1066-20121228/269004_1 /TAXON_ID=671091 /ORGANISM="Coscinodiscus wailesii, Strain CCMP2513" /LENGTH=79 /DNA_ID=CAMNT_0013296677 /DNA_START=143 /DNA_END=385 /DNA_ORIENTATION=+
MGGAGWYYVPKVWTPAGGWWNNPKNWRTNTGILGVGLVLTSFMIFRVSAAKERRPVPPLKHIPSQRWCKFAKIDDPSYK